MLRQLHVPAVSPDSYMTNENECAFKSTVQGRTGVNDGILVYPACAGGSFIENNVPRAPNALGLMHSLLPHAVHSVFRDGLRLG